MLQRHRTRFSGPIARLRRHKQGGSTIVEMALLAPVFFLFLIGITEVALIIAAQQLIESASYNASRLGKTGYVASGSTQSQTVSQIITNQLSAFGNLIDVSKVKTTMTAYSSFSTVTGNGQGTNGYGTQQQIVVYTISYPWPLFTPMLGQIIGTWDSNSARWVLNLNSQIVVRNEPYG